MFRMDHGGFRKASLNLGLVFALLVMLSEMSDANVILIGNNMSFSFHDMEARFVPAMKGSGICGMLHVVEPSDACLPLRNKAGTGVGVNSPFALIQRGACSFDKKIRNAQDAGFKAAIVYNNKDKPELVSMGGDSTGIMIYAVFVSKVAGQQLLKYAGNSDMECWIVPSLENAWSVIVISFATLVALALILAICIFVRKCWQRQVRRRNPRHHQLHGMSFRLVKALPSLIFSSVTDDNCTSETCAVCLENYMAGEKLRVLPCRHKFHARCIDNWLTMWRTFCPVCKRDARITTVQPPMTENTPLLTASALISSSIQSAHLSGTGSPYMHIASSSSLTCSGSSNSHHSPNISILSRNSGNIANTSFLSIGVHSSLLSPQNSFALSPQMTPLSVSSRGGSLIPCSYTAASPQLDASFTHPSLIPSCGGSVVVISPFNSTHSLPGFQECFV